jgi:SAM-dependent methyltransferase
MVGNPDQSAILRAIRDKYKRVARSAAGLFKYPTGPEGARALGYDDETVATALPEFLRSFCGTGNPFALGEIAEGEAVLDVGCGAGFDLLVASRLVGPTGNVFGIDITPEMVALATENIARSGIKNVEVRQGTSEALPFEESSFEVVISNGVLNLSPRKERTFEEIFRVLKPGGWLQFSDIVLDNDLPEEIVGSLEAWSD